MAFYSVSSASGGELTYSVISASNMQNAINYFSSVDLRRIKKLTTTTVNAGATLFFTALYQPTNTNIVCQASSFANVYYYMQDLIGPAVNPTIMRINSTYYTTS